MQYSLHVVSLNILLFILPNNMKKKAVRKAVKKTAKKKTAKKAVKKTAKRRK